MMFKEKVKLLYGDRIQKEIANEGYACGSKWA